MALQEANRKAGGKYILYEEMAKHLIAWKMDPALACEGSAVASLAAGADESGCRLQAFFDKIAGHPRFKNKDQGDRFRYPQGFELDQANCRIFLPKPGGMQYRYSRDVPGTMKTVTVSQLGGKWLISIKTEREVPQPAHPSTSAVGIDVGIARFAMLSDGTAFALINSFKKHQRAMSRKQKFSRSWIKAKAGSRRYTARALMFAATFSTRLPPPSAKALHLYAWKI